MSKYQDYLKELEKLALAAKAERLPDEFDISDAKPTDEFIAGYLSGLCDAKDEFHKLF